MGLDLMFLERLIIELWLLRDTVEFSQLLPQQIND